MRIVEISCFAIDCNQRGGWAAPDDDKDDDKDDKDDDE